MNNPAQISTFFATLILTVVISAPVSAAPALASRENTPVSIKVSQVGAEEFRYAVKIDESTLRKCRKERKAIVFHDENENGKREDGEPLIAKGKTSRKGKFNSNSDFEPPEGAKIAVIVRRNESCKVGRADTSDVVPEKQVMLSGNWSYLHEWDGCSASGQIEQVLEAGEGVYQTFTPESQQVTGTSPCSYITAGDVSNRTVGPISTILSEPLTQSELTAAYSAFFGISQAVKVFNADKYRVSTGSNVFTYIRVSP